MTPTIVTASISARSRFRRLLSLGMLAAASALPGRAFAQADVMPAAPNVLLLVDTSGSMDYKTNTTTFPTCHYSGSSTTVQTSERSRWIELVEVLTGSINNYDCQKLDRNSTAFKTEYTLASAPPYDFLYANPYHRPVSNGCVPGPGIIDSGNAAAFPTGAIKYHPFDNTAASCTFQQTSDGILDSYLTDVRFGLMTFDTEPKPDKTMAGLWSYYVGSAKKGEPAGCLTPQDQEVGVRNASAPAWEGRAVGFGNPALGSVDYKSRNAMIQQVLLATRPYGATPIAGMLDDARTYFTADDTADPIDGSFKFGPKDDPAKDCRKRSIVLLSDGQPNMDLRPFCEPAGCPYSKAEDIAQDLKSRGIEIYVIGFALSKMTVAGNERTCASFATTDFDETNATGICRLNPNDAAIQACCSLNRIAAAGGHTPTSPSDPDWRRARFADSRDELRAALSQAIGGSFKSTTRTPFVNASGTGFVASTSDLTFARSYRFSASFEPGKLDKPWIGELNRGRYTCKADLNNVLKPELLPPDATKGDKFVDNINKDGPDKRKIYTVLGSAPIDSSATMRPNLAPSTVDGAGTYSGSMNSTPLTSATFVSTTTPEAIKVTDTTCDSTGVDLDKNACRDRYLKWLVGLPNDTVYSRCPSLGDKCNLVAEFYHSVPRAVTGRPSRFLVDESYQKFTRTYVKRPSVLYASSNDGFLHAFKMGQVDTKDTSESMLVKTLETNELWAFIPPAVLPGIPSTYPGTHQLLLDGTPAIKEVVATDNPLGTYKFLLERNQADASSGKGAWRTILVQSFGAQRPGYFALDVTDPVPTGTGGPKFLWQLVTDAAGNQLFGSGGGTPAITTVYIGGKEVAVAVLPGGYGSAGTNGAVNQNGCNRKTNVSTGTFFDRLDSAKPRSTIPCYTDTAVLARSLTVVRLDSGEILRTFRQAETEVPGLVGKNKTTVAELDSPMTGQPVPYPADVGAVADRVFIGDQDGTLWRLNFASKNGVPSEWKVELFFDGFPSGTGYGYGWNAGQPIVTAPIISVNQKGYLTIAFSTGEQEAVGAKAGLANFVWSLTEEPSADRKALRPLVNWSLDFTTAKGLSGDRVIGEMALFNGDLYFSTVGPPSDNDACSSGSGKVWGMHYLTPHASGTGKGGRPAPSLAALLSSGGYIDATTLLGTDAKAFLSGATVSQQPTCESPGTSEEDSFFANGNNTAKGGTVTPGKFQLIIPTGDKVSTTNKPGVTPITQGKANAVAVDLPAPPVMNYVDSWATIVE